MRNYLMSGYFKCERTFDEEASDLPSQISNNGAIFGPDLTQKEKKSMKVEKLRNEECIICLEKMALTDEVQTFLKTNAITDFTKSV